MLGILFAGYLPIGFFPGAILVSFFILKKPVLILAAILLIAIGFVRFNFQDINFMNSIKRAEKLKDFTFVITEPVEQREHYQLLQGKITNSDNARAIIKYRGLIPLSPGTVLSLKGAIKRAETEELFSYGNYLKSRMYVGEIEYDDAERIGVKNSTYFSLLKFRALLNQKINSILPAPNSGLLTGLLIGAKDGIRGETLKNFNKTGTTHIVAASGFNIVLLISFIMFFLRRKNRASLLVAVFLIILFTVIAGATASVVRAAVMGIVALYGTHVVGREKDGRAALFFAALVMLLLNPFSLLYDLSFILSFMATAGLIFIEPKLAKRLPFPNNLKLLIAPALSAQIFTLPIIFLAFGSISLVGLIANLLILPAVPIAMFLGFIATITSFIDIKFGQIAAFFANIPLEYILKVTEYLSSLSYSEIKPALPTLIPISAISMLFIVVYKSIFFGQKNEKLD